VLRSRILTAAVGLPAIVLAIVLGPGPYSIFLTIVSGGCAIELALLLSPGLRRPLSVAAVIWAVLLATRFLSPLQDAPDLLITVPLVIVLLLLLPLGARRQTFAAWAWSIAGAFYAGWLMGYWGGLYLLPSGPTLVMLGLLTTFAYDTSAYFSGRAFGRHKLAPSLSGAKTWEGVIGGLCGALVICWVMYLLLARLMGPFPFGVQVTPVIAVVVSAAAQAGDLVESALKRTIDVKDAGTVLPGHGGMLDRFDSVLFTGAVLYYVSLWLTA